MELETQTSSTWQARVSAHREVFSGSSERAPAYYRDYLDITPINAVGNSGRFVSQKWGAGSYLFEQSAMDAIIVRHYERHSSISGNLLQVVRYVSGGAMGSIDEQPVSSPVGIVSISDWARPFEGIQSAGICQSIFVSRQTIGVVQGACARRAQYDNQTKMGRILHSEMDYFFDQFLTGTPSVSRLRLDKLHSVIRSAFSGEGMDQDIRSNARDALSILIKRHIEVNLKSPNLTASSLLCEFGVSRASLYRIFELDGGVRKYINDRRLYNAVRALSSAPVVRGQMSRVAEEWCFSSYAIFNRAVRRAYGVSPKFLFETSGEFDVSATVSACTKTSNPGICNW
ncbi:MAG: hypothetical protein ABJH52_03055 [Henriciella sp.]